MTTYSLEIDDFSDDDYTLIAVHTSIEDYKLAFLMNTYLQTSFKRTNYDLDFKRGNSNSFYSVYEYTNKKEGYDWFLISNVYKTQSLSDGLFNESESKTFLIPEKKRVDYFFKIEGNVTANYIIKSMEKINQIPQIITSYQIETNTLKSKNSLIF